MMSLSPSQSFMVGESEALLKETLMPVYVAPEDEQLLYMYEEVKQAAATRTSSIFIRGERSEMMRRCTFRFKTRQHVYTKVCVLSLLAVLRSMVTATAFQILVSNNVPIKAITDNTIVALEVRLCISVKPDHFGSSVLHCITDDLYFRECSLVQERMCQPSSSLRTMIPMGWHR